MRKKNEQNDSFCSDWNCTIYVEIKNPMEFATELGDAFARGALQGVFIAFMLIVTALVLCQLLPQFEVNEWSQ